MTENGQVSKLSIDPRLLTPDDMDRAEVALAEWLDGRDPYDMLDERKTAVPLTIWCLFSRNDPSFTWEQARHTPFLGDFEPASPPQIPPPDASGSSRGRNGGNASRKQPAEPAAEPASAPTSP
jgi:hypothetical protein